MKHTLTSREKNLLLLCVAVLVTMGTVIATSYFLQKRAKLVSRISELEMQRQENKVLMSDADYWQKRDAWLTANMPKTDSLGKSQGQLLEDLENEALEHEIKIMQKTMLEPVTTENYREVAVNLRLWGDQTRILQWIATMQSPEKFQAVKSIEFEIDTRSRAATPQATCNLTLAKWFKPEVGA